MKSRWRKSIRLCAAVVLVPGVALSAYAFCHYSAAAPTYVQETTSSLELPHRLRNGAEHDAARQRNGGNPYILSIEHAEGSLVYYGASHTREPDHPQLEDIETRWNAFLPTVALCEGRTRGYFYGGLIEPFAGLPEPALVHKLARRDDVTIFSLEPAYEEEVEALLADFKPEQVALYFFLRVYVSEAGGVADDGLALDLLKKRTDVAGLRECLSSLDDVDRIWKQDFPGKEDWRILTSEPDENYVPRISDHSRRIRGEHMVRILIDLVQKGERVFAVVGSGHVIRQEWNLRAVFGQEPAWDQPDPES